MRGSLEDVARGVEPLDGLAALHEQDHLIELGLDVGVHLVPVAARKPRLAGVAERVLLAEDERVHDAVERVVAQKAQRIRAGDGALLVGEEGQPRLERVDQTRGKLVVHDVAQIVIGAQPRAGDGIEQGVGTLVAQKERLRLVA
mgnify:CR=1 FL=1